MLRSCESDKIGECKVIGCLGHHSVVQDLNGCPLVDHPWKEWNGRNGGAKQKLFLLLCQRRVVQANNGPVSVDAALSAQSCHLFRRSALQCGLAKADNRAFVP